MTKRSHSTLWVLLALLAAAGCTTMGTGYGTTAAGTNPVRFNWTSSDGVSGTMSATLADGSVYAGSFFQVTDNTTADTFGPAWDGSGYGWSGGPGYGWGFDWNTGGGFGGWGTWDTGTEVVTHYTGRVIANLVNPKGKHIRCKFQLAHPSNGMAGGGLGDCELPEGKTIDASFSGAS
jgi:hypothetical protein